MAGTVVKAGAKVEYSIIDEEVVIGENATVGAPKDSGLGLDEKGKGIAVIGRNTVVEAGASVAPGVIVDAMKKVK